MKALVAIFFVLLATAGIIFLVFYQTEKQFLNPLGEGRINTVGKSSKKKDLFLNKYTFVNPAAKELSLGEIVLEEIIVEEEKYTSYLFSYQTEGKKVTGMLNLPKKSTLSPACPATGGGKLPAVIMLRGYADDSIYFTGLGTRKAAGELAKAGFITFAPDFLGFGGSDTPSVDILEARFQRPLTVLSLLKAVETFPSVDPENLFLWGHSNGGQIALSVLEITQKNIPTVLWSPVTKGFPECVLYYMGELDDQGMKVKKAIDQFVEDYQGEDFSVDSHYDLINTSIQVHQGLRDPLIPLEWTQDFLEQMKNLNREVEYFRYPKADHNLVPDWDQAINRTINFFKRFAS